MSRARVVLVALLALLAVGFSGPQNANQLRGRNVSTTVPAAGEVLTYDGAQWAPQLGAAPILDSDANNAGIEGVPAGATIVWTPSPSSPVLYF